MLFLQSHGTVMQSPLNKCNGVFLAALIKVLRKHIVFDFRFDFIDALNEDFHAVVFQLYCDFEPLHKSMAPHNFQDVDFGKLGLTLLLHPNLHEIDQVVEIASLLEHYLFHDVPAHLIAPC